MTPLQSARHGLCEPGWERISVDDFRTVCKSVFVERYVFGHIDHHRTGATGASYMKAFFMVSAMSRARSLTRKLLHDGAGIPPCRILDIRPMAAVGTWPLMMTMGSVHIGSCNAGHGDGQARPGWLNATPIASGACITIGGMHITRGAPAHVLNGVLLVKS
jgi:hypothetical protein